MVRQPIGSNSITAQLNNNINAIPSNTNVPLYLGLIWLILLNLVIGGGVLTPPTLVANASTNINATGSANGLNNATSSIANPASSNSNNNTTTTYPATPAQAAQARQAYARLPLAFEVNAGQVDGQVRYLARGQGYSLFFTDDGTATLDLRRGDQAGNDKGEGSGAGFPHGSKKDKTGKNQAGSNSNSNGANDDNGRGDNTNRGRGDDDEAGGPNNGPVEGIALALKLIGAKHTGQPTPEQPLAATSNYFNGNNPAQWQTGLKTYGQLTYKGVYRGIDLSYTGQQARLEYQFTVAPGADVSQIAFQFEGVSRATLQADGSLLLASGSEKITQAPPTIYQLDPITGQRQTIAGGFTLNEIKGSKGTDSPDTSKGDNSDNGNNTDNGKNKTYQIGFKLTGNYDPARPLIIDPVLSYSTFIGGSAIDSGQAIKVDSAGAAYVIGYTLAGDFPTTAGAYQVAYNDGNTGGYDVFVTKLNTSGTGLVYSTYLGGNGIDYGLGLDIDNSGLVYLTGATNSSNFPTTSGAYSTTLAVVGSDSMFVARLSATGTLNYATLIGGDGGDYGRAIVVDRSNPNRVFVAGEGYGNTGGTFPTTANALVKRQDGGGYDGLLLQLDLSQSGAAQLVYSSYFGGNGEDVIYALSVDTATSPARLYITGYTTSTNMSVTNVATGGFGAAYQSAKGSTAPGQDAFVAVLSPGSVTTTLLYSSYLGGNGDEVANSISLDSNKNIYLAGQTTSLGTGSSAFPTTTNALTPRPQSGTTQQGFLTVLSPTLSGSNQLRYSTYLGGSKADRALAVVADSTSANQGQVYVGGVGNSSDLPVSAGAFQPTISVTNGITGDHGFVIKLDTTKSGSNSLVYGTHLGGSTSYRDRVAALALDGSGNAYLTGSTTSTDFPTTAGVVQTTSKDGYEAFVTKLNASGTALSYSTYLGGGSRDSGGGVAVGSDGSFYLAGQTNASVFPANTGFYTATTPNNNAGLVYQDYHLFAVRLSPDGNGLLYSTYIGGSGNDQASYGAGLDNNGNFYLAGYTTSPDFPTTSGAYNTSFGTGIIYKTVALKLNPTGGLAYSTYFGGNNSTVARAVAVSGDGSRFYLTGATNSDASAFPLKGAYQTSYNGGNDGFLAVLNPLGSGTNDLVNSTLFGGSGTDQINAIALDGAGGIYLTGFTGQPVTATLPFPTTTGAYQSNYSAAAGGGANNTAFVSKFTTTGSTLSLAYSTLLGGNLGNQVARSIVADSQGYAYVLGFTTASNFPTTASAYQRTLKGANDLFVTKVATNGTGLVYSTLLGGSGSENCPGSAGLALDSQVISQVVGVACTNSSDFPTSSAGLAYQTRLAGGNDAVVFKLNPTGSGLAYSTYLGGSQDDQASGVGVDRLGNIYVGGTTGSNDFPTTAGAYQTTSAGGNDSFAAKVSQVKLVFTTQPGGGPVSSPLITQPVVQVQSLLSSAVITTYNGPITLTIKAGTGTPGAVLSGTTVITAVNGTASFTNLAINQPGTGYVLTARGNLIDPIDSNPFNIGAAAGQPARLVVYSGSAQSAVVSTSFALPLVAQVQDAYNTPISGAIVTFTASALANSATGTFAASGGGASVVTATSQTTSGTATSPVFTANGLVGSYNVTATVSGVITPAVFVLTNTAQPIITPTLVFSRQVGRAVAGSPFVTQPVVTVLNPDNSLATSFNGPVSVSIKAGSGTPNAVLTGTTTLTATAGVVTYTNLVINLPGQNYVLTAASPGLTSTDSLPFTVTAASPARIVAMGGTPQSTQVNTVFTNSLVAQVFDTNNQPVSGTIVTFQAPVLTTTTASGTFSGGLSSVTATTNISGTATAPLFTANAITGTYSVTATVSGVITPASFVLTNTALPPVPTSLIFNQQPDGAVAGSIFVTQPIVSVLNNDGTPATGFSGPISVSIKPGSGTANALLAGTTTLTATAGVVTYTNLTINLAGQNYVLTAASSGLTTTDSLPFTVTQPISQPTTIIAVAGTPQSTVISTPFATALAAQVLDGNSQPVSGAIVTFQAPVLTTTTASGTFSGGLSSITATTNVSGTATAPLFTANAITGTYVVTASVSGVITPASFALTNTAQPLVPTSLVFSLSPGGAVASSPFLTQPVVTALNSDGTPSTSFSGTVSVSIKPGSGTVNAILTGTTTLTATAGVVTYTNLAIDLAGPNYILTAVSPGLTSTDSLPFTVTQPISGGIPASIVAVGGTPQSTVVSTPFASRLTALVQDSAGNPVSGTVVTFTAPVPTHTLEISSTNPVTPTQPSRLPSASFGVTAEDGSQLVVTVTTSITGTALSPLLTANPFSGPYLVTATVEGVVTPTSFALTNLDIPSAPSDMTAHSGDSQISLSWSTPVYTGSSPITGYNVYRLNNGKPVSLTTAGPLPASALLTATYTYTDTGLTNYVEYFYMVTAINSVGESGYSFWARAIPHSSAPIPTAPILVSAVGASGQVTVYWKSVVISSALPPVSGYNLYRVDSAGNSHQIGAGLPLSPTIYTDSGLTNGSSYTYTVTALNSAGESQPSNPVAALPHEEVLLPEGPKLVSATGGVQQITLSWMAPPVINPGVTGYVVYRLNNQNVPITLTQSPLGAGTTSYTDTSADLKPATRYDYVVRAVNANGIGGLSNVLGTKTGSGRPDLQPPALDLSVPTTVYSDTYFLYNPPNPIQTGVTSGTINPVRVALLRGQVTDRNGHPLVGVNVKVVGHPEYGNTHTLADGWFNLAVNGGGRLVMDYQLTGYIAVQRLATPDWQSYNVVAPVVMIGYDPAGTPVSLDGSSTEIKIAQSSVVSDADGSRRSTLLFPAGTSATLKMADGSTQPFTGGTVRATEFTVGSNGKDAMPGELPPTSGYTYALDFSFDEAITTGAISVEFDKAVINYTDNFLKFPAGTAVPVGYYDQQKGVWVAVSNGIVIKVLQIDSGKAVLDVDGSGQAASSDTLAQLGITDDELVKIATLYTAGQSFWRVTLSHFTPFDCNWPVGSTGKATNATPHKKNRCPFCYGLDAEDDAATNDDPNSDSDDSSSDLSGSTSLTYQTQATINASPVTTPSLNLSGTDFSLYYQNHWTFNENRTYGISLTGAVVPTNLVAIVLKTSIAGQDSQTIYSPSSNLTGFFTWDGKDSFDRTIQGLQKADITVIYYGLDPYLTPSNTQSSFGFATGGAELTQGRCCVGASYSSSIYLGSWDSRKLGLGGWTPNVVNLYDPAARTLYLGNGSTRLVSPFSGAISTIAGNGQGGTSGDGGPAISATLSSGALVSADDGTLYVTDLNRIRKISPNGIITTIAGGGNLSVDAAEGKSATLAQLYTPTSLALGPDGALYIAELNTARVRKVDLTTGKISTVAGNGYPNQGNLPPPPEIPFTSPNSGGVSPVTGAIGDGGPATAAVITAPIGVAVSKAGIVYIADSVDNRVRQVNPNGTILTVAGTGDSTTYAPTGDGGSGVNASVYAPSAVAVGPDGSLFIATDHFVRKLSPSGIITTIAGITLTNSTYTAVTDTPALGTAFYRISDIKVDGEGNVYILDAGYYGAMGVENHRLVRLGKDGFVHTITGNGLPDDGSGIGDGGLATSAQTRAIGFALGQDGNIYLADAPRVRQVTPVLPGFNDQDIFIKSSDGTQIYHFDHWGHQLQTLDAVTQQVIYNFSYSVQGQLISINDANNTALLTASYPASGNSPVQLYGSGNQLVATLTLDANGYLDHINFPDGTTGSLSGNTFNIGSLHATDGKPTTGVKPDGGLQTQAANSSSSSSGGGSPQDFTYEDGILVPTGQPPLVELGGCYGSGVRSTQFYDFEPTFDQWSCQGVNTSTRNYVAGVIDLAEASPAGSDGMGLVFGRNYNAQDPLSKTLGYSGWRHSYQWELVNSGGDVTVIQPGGRRDVYSGTNTISPTTSGRLSDATLLQNEDGTYTLTQLDLTTYTFDSQGKLTTIQNRNGYQIKLSYGTNGNPAASLSEVSLCLPNNTNCGVQKLTLTSNSAGYITDVSDQSGRHVSFSYSNNLLQQATDANGYNTSYDYYDGDQGYRLKQVTGPDNGTTIKLDYNKKGWLTTVTDGLGQATSVDYYPVDPKAKIKATMVTNIQGNTYYYCWNSISQTLRVHNPAGNDTNFLYDASDRITATQDYKGNWTYTTYYTNGLLSNITRYVHDNSGGKVYKWSYAYNDHNQPTLSTDARGLVTKYYYDNGDANNPSKVEDPKGNTVNYSYDQPGRVQFATTSNGLTTKYDYDSNDFPQKTTIQNLSTLVKGSSTDPTQVNYETNYQYDGLGRLKFKSDPISSTVGMHYEYDGLDHLLNATNQTGEKAVNQYDKAGNLTESTNFLGHKVKYNYDANNQINSTIQYVTGGNIKDIYTYKQGNLAAHTDANGIITAYGYDVLNRTTAINGPDPTTVQNEYDALGNLTKVTYSSDNATCYDYDELNRPLNVTRGCGSFNYHTRYTYDEDDNITGQNRDIEGGNKLVSSADYDGLNRPLHTQLNNDNGNLVTSYEYNDTTNVQTVTDPAGRTTTLSRDALGRTYQQTVKGNDGTLAQTTYYQYDPNSRVARVWDAENYWHDTAYDLLGRAKTNTVYSGTQGTGETLTTSTDYDEIGLPSYTQISPAGISRFAMYDEAGRLVRQSVLADTTWLSTGYKYDGQGNLTSLVDPNNHETTYEYSAAGWLKATHQSVTGHPDGGGILTTAYDYDNAGNLIKTTDAANHITSATYDALNRQITQSDAYNHTWQYKYDGLDRRTFSADPNGVQTTYQYEKASFLKSIQTAATSSAPAVATSFTNNELGQPLSMVDQTGAALITTTYHYDPLGRLQTLTNPQGQISYNYDNLNRRTFMAYQFNGQPYQLAYHYDGANRLVQLTEGDVNTFDYGYRGELLTGTLYPAIRPTGAVATGGRPYVNYDYDGAGRLQTVNHRTSGGALMFAGGYRLDKLGNVLGTSEQFADNYDANHTQEHYQNFAYDEMSRLWYTLDVYAGSAALNTSREYTYDYDGAGNRLGKVEFDPASGVAISRTAAQYDITSRLMSQTLLTWQGTQPVTTTTLFDYDSAGNLLSQVAHYPWQDQPITYRYDGRNRLIYAQNVIVTGTSEAMTQTLGYSYDGMDHRISSQAQLLYRKSLGSSTGVYPFIDSYVTKTEVILNQHQSYLQDPASGLAVVLGQLTTGSITEVDSFIHNYTDPRTLHPMTDTTTLNPAYPPLDSQETYTYQPGSTSPLLVNTGGSPANRVYNHQDGQGSLRVTHDNTREEVQDWYVYGEPFGITLAFSQTAPTANTHQFAGEEHETNGLYYDRARYYDPSIGRFTQQDTYGGSSYDAASLNRYTYARNNPTTYTDPSGHCPICFAALAGALWGGGIDYASQVLDNALKGEGWSSFTNIKLDRVLVSAAAGAVAGGVFKASEVALSMRFGTRAPSGFILSEYGHAYVQRVAGGLSAVVGGELNQLGNNLLDHKPWSDNLFNPVAIGLQAGFGVAAGWLGTKLLRRLGITHGLNDINPGYYTDEVGCDINCVNAAYALDRSITGDFTVAEPGADNESPKDTAKLFGIPLNNWIRIKGQQDAEEMLRKWGPGARAAVVGVRPKGVDIANHIWNGYYHPGGKIMFLDGQDANIVDWIGGEEVELKYKGFYIFRTDK